MFHQLLRGAELPARLCSDAHLAALGLSMRTNIVIDDALMKQAMQASGARSKREAVELALRTLVNLQQQGEIRAFRGRLAWEGDLETQRLDHAIGELQA